MKITLLPPLVGLAAGAAVAAPAPGDAIMQTANGEIVFRDYPSRALAAGEQGKVGFQVKADDQGFPVNCEITSSSGHPQLDNDTCRLLMVHATFKSVPGTSANIVNRGTVNWTISPWLLEARKATPAKKILPTPKWGWSRKARNPDKVEIATAAGDKQICKRVPRTGTLAGFERICRSREDWDKTSEANGIWADQQGTKGFTRGN